jgi:hypothetical protein
MDLLVLSEKEEKTDNYSNDLTGRVFGMQDGNAT